MADTDELDIEPGTTAVEEAHGQSLLERIRARREEDSDDLELAIPSWGGELLARYKVLDRIEIEKMVRRIRGRQRGNGDGGSEPDLDFLIRACTAVIARDDETGETHEITNGFNPQLADLLGNPEGTGTARGLLLYLLKGNTIALAAHAMKVAKWMQDTSVPVEDPQ